MKEHQSDLVRAAALFMRTGNDDICMGNRIGRQAVNDSEITAPGGIYAYDRIGCFTCLVDLLEVVAEPFIGRVCDEDRCQVLAILIQAQAQIILIDWTKNSEFGRNLSF